MAFVAPGMTKTKILARVAALTGKTVGDATDLLTIYEAISTAAYIACKHREWWFLRSSGTFNTVDDTGTYALRTQIDTTVDYPYEVWYDTGSTNRILMQSVSHEQWRTVTNVETENSIPRLWSMNGDDNMVLHPTPNLAKEITVYFIKRHGAIDATSDEKTDFIIPPEFHQPIYVDGAAWLIQHETEVAASVMDCPQYVNALNRMAATSQEGRDRRTSENRYGPYMAYSWDSPIIDGRIVHVDPL